MSRDTEPDIEPLLREIRREGWMLQATQVIRHNLNDAEHTLRAVLSIPPDAVASAPYQIPESVAYRRPNTDH
jgi:hypothetical protein